ncbi:translation termination factor GTPase eRF3 [Tilletia horrida]|uniref:Eukaryotic peptide chain release factor GTP-binding subunit n=1 Tax=Tilletia horrida TaxID=155126 RepID=A0AAN6GUB9_9BASI|nr:translation termination factor GTPase eRF3 [Tilletia horrida]
MNPNARSFNFNPAAQGFVPPQVAAQLAAQQAQQGQAADPNTTQQQQFNQQYQGGYQQGGYVQQGGYYQGGQQGGHGRNQQQQPYYAQQGGYGAQYAPQQFQQPQQQQQGYYQSQQFQQPQQQPYRPPQHQQPAAGAAAGLPPRPQQANSSTPSTAAPASAAAAAVAGVKTDRKPVSLSLGAMSLKDKETPAAKASAPAASAAAPAKAESKPAPAPVAPAAAPASEQKKVDDAPAAAPAKPVADTAPSAASAAAPAGANAEAEEPGKGAVAKRAAKVEKKVEKSQMDADKVLEETKKVTDEETLKDLFGDKADDMKSHLNVVFIGHVDAGKSTMGGNLLYLTGMVDKRTLEKYEREAKEAGRESWYLSWALDSTPQEREKGKTVEVGRAYFETGKRRYTILDAPGHKTYVPSMISGAAQADVAILVISARRGEFETGFERGGQTREHVMLVKTAGVQRLIIVINKMDEPTVKWEKERFDEIVGKLTPFLRQSGFNPKTDATFIPVSAYSGANLKDKVAKDVCSWWEGPSLLDYLDNLSLGDRKIGDPLKMPISEKYNDMGTIIVGKLEAGKVRRGDTLLLMPNRTTVEAAAIYNEMEEEVPAAISGDNVRIRLKGVDHDDVNVGFVLTDPKKPVTVATQFEAQLAILESKNIICAGYSAVMHIHTLSEEITLPALLHYYDKKTGKKSRKPPQFAKKGMKIVALIETAQPVCVERYTDNPQLGRFTIRDEGITVAIGKVSKIHQDAAAAAAVAAGATAAATE